ncbi:MAG: glycosyl transferase family 2 [Acidobacteria bacterium]|nr:MAG: glycosyl transferase family 2 [Acidobacteriota bacterium]
MSLWATAIVSLYLATLLVLSLYGCHRLYLLNLHLRQAPGRDRRRLPGPDGLPRVTVQLPIYNERYVVARLIRAACALEYPRDRLEIQVLDDSSDETSRIAAREIEAMRRSGMPIVHLRRGHREGFKAGALADGLRSARGDLVAIFDADFVPPPRFLLDLVHHFEDPRVGMVQARWGHLNRDFSLLTRVQSIFLDGHFIIEHAARHGAGLFFNFNGTAGVWRRSCIESAGGWRSDTLTEDLDLSYRAQILGWRFVFDAGVVAPAELPATMDAFRSQQHRWARGSIQTGLKLLPRLLRARLPVPVKVEAFFHLSSNGAYVLMLLLALLIVPAMVARRGMGIRALLLVDLPLFLMSTGSVSAFYLCAQRRLGRGWRSSLASLPFVMALGIGLALNNSRAVLGALAGRRAEFVRTPKYSLNGAGGDWRGKAYRARRARLLPALEILFGLYFTAAGAYAILTGMYASLPFLVLFQTGFLYASLLSLFQGLGRRAATPAAGIARLPLETP